MRQKKTVQVIMAALVIGCGSFAMAQERAYFAKTADVKGYGKRDRTLLNSEQSLSPSQLHEIYGARADAGLDVNMGRARYATETDDYRGPQATARALWGGDIVVAGMGGGYGEALTKSDNVANVEEKAMSRKFLPLIAFSFTENMTAGVQSDFNWVQIQQDSDLATANEFNSYTRRENIGASFHTPRFEVGFVHATSARATATANVADDRAQGFGLVAADSDTERAIYLPAHNTVFARGNLTEMFSMNGAVSHVEYDANDNGAKPYMEQYRRADRTAAQMQGVLWLPDRASRFAATALYRGATYAPFGTEETGLGYRDVNLYGGTVEGVAELARRTYLGLSVGYMRGERNQDTDVGRIAAREERTKIGTTFSMSM